MKHITYNLRYILMLVTLLLLAGPAVAQTFQFVGHEYGDKRTATQIKAHDQTGTQLNEIIYAQHNHWQDMLDNPTSWGNNLKLQSVHAYVRFFVDHHYKKKILTPYTFRLVYTLYGYNHPADTNIYSTFNDTLTISYDPDSLATYQDYQVKQYGSFSKIKVVLHGLYEITSPTAPPVPVNMNATGNFSRLNFVVEPVVIVQPFIKKTSAGAIVYGNSTPVLKMASAAPANNLMVVRWALPGTPMADPIDAEPAAYELEWTYVDDYKVNTLNGTVGYLPKAQLKYDFTHNSTRVWLDTNYYKIPIVYQHGYILYRVRMVRPDSVFFRFPIYSKWSLPESGLVSGAGSANYRALTTPYMSDKLNWQYTVSFAEQGKFKNVLSFYDGLLKNRQSITRFNSSPGLLIATENVYDYEGRPSISVLPTPIPTQGFVYQPLLAISQPSGLPYQASDFDNLALHTCPTDNTPPALKSTSKAYIYYSTLNPDKSGAQKFVPSAGGYPFVETLYSPGYDKRVDKQGGAGNSLQIGGNHAVKNNYVSEDQMDLNRLFGTDIGWSGFYRKTVSKDPNGQLSLNVTDYHGKTVTSSMIGVPDTNTVKLAIIPNPNVPNASTFNEDFIAGTTQQVSGNKIILDKSIFNDAPVNALAQYKCDFAPYPTLCGKFLAVKVHYDYKIYDECGTIKGQDSGTMSKTGVFSSGGLLSGSHSSGFAMDKGQYNIHKELTINLQDVHKAVDSFMEVAGCLKTERQFIKEAVLSKKFPCPDGGYSQDPCAQKKAEMMQELWPNIDSIYTVRKYGIYTLINGVVVGNGNSIFSVIGNAGGQVITGIKGTSDKRGYYIEGGVLKNGSGTTVPFHYRYQDSCLVQLPDTVYFMGHAYTHLSALPVDTFIMIFNDAIAEALLPLHPEYCDLLNCGDDAYVRKLESIPDAATAEGLGLFRLTQIIQHDPLYTIMQANTNKYHGHALDTLARTRGGLQSLDTLAIGQAYCQCGNTNMMTVCLNHIFQQPVAGGVFNNDYVKAQYFSQIVSLYIANRSRYLFNLSGDDKVDCATCSDVRMTLVPPPVFSQDFTPSGGLATGPGSFLGTAMTINPSGATSMQNWLQYINNYDSTNLGGYVDSINALYNGQNDTLGLGAVNQIKQQIVNCSLDSDKINAVGDTLFAMVQAHLVSFGNFTPEQIRYALTVNGIALTDLCNPYIVNYDNIAPGSAGGDNPFSCKDASFYTAATNFLKNVPLKALEHIGTQYAVTLTTTNAFEAPVITSIGTTAAKVKATYSANAKLYTVYIYKTSTADAGAVRVYFQDGNSGSCAQTFHLNTGETIKLSVDCINNAPAGYFNGLASGYIGNYTFAATVTHTQSGQVTTCLLPGWTDRVPMNTTAEHSIAAAVPPTQMKALYKQFWDTLKVYQVHGIDHPYYRTMLRNFMNWNLHKSYAASQYERYIESCALADSMDIPMSGHTYAVVQFSVANIEVSNFINAVISIDSNIHFTPFFVTDGKSLVYDFNELPINRLNEYASFIKNYTSSSLSAVRMNTTAIAYSPTDMGRLYIPTSSGFTPNTTNIFGNAVYPFTFTRINHVYNVKFGDGPTTGYNIYVVKAPSGGTLASRSINTDLLRRYLLDNNISAFFNYVHKSTVGPEYNLLQKKAYLTYAYASQSRPPAKVLDTLQTQYLGLRPAFINNNLQYGQPMAPGNLQNLYVLNPDTATNGNTLFSILTYVMNQISNNLFGHPFFHTVNTKTIASNNMLTAYHCSGNVYWYRYFAPGNYLYNIFIPVPAYLDSVQLAGYKIVNFRPLPGEGNSRAFRLMLHNPALPSLDLNLTGYTDFTIARNEVLHDVLLYPGLTDHPATADTADNCERELLKSAIYEGKVAYQNYIDSIRAAVYNGFMAWMLGGHIHEELWMNYASRQFNYTLYYYDRAGNLMRTVPPAGVKYLTGSSLSQVDQHRSNGSSVVPVHQKVSLYKYNSLNQVYWQNTPDGGETKFYYDAAGRVVFSQNEKQRPTGNMTYTLYDAQGRIMETGQAKIAFPWFMPYKIDKPAPNSPSYYDPNSGLQTPYPPIVYNLKHETQQDVVNYVRNLDRSEVVVTLYDDAAMNLAAVPGMSTQENLRQRVSAIKYYDYLPAGSHPDGFTYAMYFSYDIAGNVKTLTRDYPGWKESGQEFKRVDYDYDLISGKVNLLSYNRGFADQYFQKYYYDADNRITDVKSSADGLIWQHDAGYEYYQHGPLARMTLGEQYVQGVDYAYTIQGWLKAVNGDLLNPAKDMGKDGSPSSATIEANDAMGFSIDYFKGDYRPIGADSVSYLAQPSRNLYNGNIARTTMALLPFDNLNTRYTYDQLNRIMRADYAKVSKTGALTNTAQYYSSYGYDPDGNLQKLVRNGDKSFLKMDSLVYRYTTAAPYNNQLLNVNDYVANNYDNDIRQNTNAAVSRYMYDQTGNVIKDLVSGQDTIEWNHYNKVTKTLQGSQGNGLMFAYDGAGNRYLKAATAVSGDTTKYNQEYEVRDAQGNVLAVYKGQSVYKAEKKSVWVKYVLDDMLHAVSIGQVLSQLAAPVYAQEGHFKNSFLGQAVKSTAWAQGRVKAEPVSWYLYRDDAVRVNMLGHTGNYGDFYTSMGAYTDGEGGPLLADALDSLCMKEGKGPENSFFRLALDTKSVDSGILSLVLSKLCPGKSLLSAVMGALKLKYDPKNCDNNVTQLTSYLTKNGVANFEDAVASLQEKYPADLYNFLRGVSVDRKLMSYTGYTGKSGSLLPTFQKALTDWCTPVRLGGFMDQWESAQAMLLSTNSLQSLLSVVYNDDAAAVMQSYVTNQGKNDAIVNALSAIPYLTPSSFVHAGELHLNWYHSVTLYQQILKYQRIYLASHVIYGSSRLGTKDYLPGQLYSLVDYQQAQPITDTSVLNARRAWYSAKYNDDIRPGETTPWAHTQTGAFSASERIGEKQYELSNHLGNVQATVSDNRYEVANKSTDSILAYHPALRSAYDYYPFGMLMPDRYVSDTSGHCVTVSRPAWVWKWVKECYDITMWVWPGYLRVKEGTAVKADDAIEINAPSAGDGVSFDFDVTPNVAYQLTAEISRLELTKGASVQVMEQEGEKWVPLAEVGIEAPGSLKLAFTPGAKKIRVYWWGPLRVYVRTLCLMKQEWVEEDQLVTICDDDKDKYRFGFNGKEKDNEVKGIGNSLDYGARWYDTRIARLGYSVDPLTGKFPMLTPYQFASNTPIQAIDLDGKEAYVVVKDHYTLLDKDIAVKTYSYVDAQLAPVNGVYTVHRYFTDITHPTFATGITWGLGSFSDYPKMFPNGGLLGRPDGRSELAFETEGGIVYGRLSADIDVAGKTGVDIGFGGYLIGGKYNANEGGEGYFPTTDKMDINASASYMGNGLGYSGKFNTGSGIMEDNHLNVNMLKYLNADIGGDDTKFFGIGGGIAAGIGITGRIGVRYSPPLSLSSQEERLKNALDNAKSKGTTGTKHDPTEN